MSLSVFIVKQYEKSYKNCVLVTVSLILNVSYSRKELKICHRLHNVQKVHEIYWNMLANFLVSVMLPVPEISEEEKEDVYRYIRTHNLTEALEVR